MRKLDIVNYTLAALLLLATVPMYRYLIDRSREDLAQPNPRSEVSGPVYGKRPAESPVPGGVVPASVRRLPVAYGRTVGRTWCRDGLLYWDTPNGPGPVYANGRYSKCEIQAEPARPQNSEASEQTP